MSDAKCNFFNDILDMMSLFIRVNFEQLWLSGWADGLCCGRSSIRTVHWLLCKSLVTSVSAPGTHPCTTLEVLRNALYKFKTYLLTTYLLTPQNIRSYSGMLQALVYIGAHNNKGVSLELVDPPLPSLGHIWNVMLVWRKGNINKNCLCVTDCVLL